MKTAKLLVLSVALAIAACCSTASAQNVTTEYRNDVTTILELSDMKGTLVQALGDTYANMGIMSADEARAVVSEWLGSQWDTIITLTTETYAKYFNQSDLQELIKFYQSPIGAKFAKYQGVISSDLQKSMMSNQALLSSLQTLLMQHMKK